MIRLHSFRQIVLLFCLIAGSLPLRAQFRPVRLTPDSISSALPSAALVQAAARIDHRALAVWGTTAPDSDATSSSPIRPILVFQFLDDSVPVGQPRLLHSDSARPFAFVRVVPLHDRFLVVWNDHRATDPGLYARTVSLDGALGTEYLLSPGSSIQTTIYPIANDRDVSLLWYERHGTDTTAYLRHIGYDGMPVDTEQALDVGPLSTPLAFDSLPGLHIVLRNAHPPILLRPDGTVEPRAVPAKHFTSPYYLHADTSITILVGDTVKFFRSIFDQTPIRSVHAEIPRDTSISYVLARDSLGRLFLAWDTFKLSGSYAMDAWLSIWRSSMNSDSTFSAADTAVVEHLIGGSNYTRIHYLGARASIGQECNNAKIIYVFIYANRVGMADGTNEEFPTNMTVGYYAAPSGEIARYVGTLPGRCNTPDLPVARARWFVPGTITVDGVRLGAPTASWPLNIPERWPNLYRRGSDLFVTWGEGERYVVGRLNTIGDSLAVEDTTVAWQSPGLNDIHQSVDGFSMGGSYGYTSTYISPQNGGPLYANTPHGTTYIGTSKGTWATTPVDFYYWTSSSRYNGPIWQQPDRFGYDPVTEDIVTGYVNSRSRNHWLARLDPQGDTVWTARLATPQSDKPMDLIALPDRGFLYVRDNRTLCNSTDSFLLVPTTSEARYQSLLGNRILRIYATDSNSRAFELEIYDMRGRLQQHHRIEMTSRTEIPYVLQNPKDSSLIILWGSGSGLGLAHLTQTLQPGAIRRAPHLDSIAHPAAAVRNDSLFLVWEDFRNNSADIYGMVMTIPPAVDPPEIEPPIVDPPDTTTTDMAISVAPNPVFGAARLELFLQQPAPVRIDVVDDLGRLVYRETTEELPAGNNEVEVDLGSLFGGAYTVTATTDHGTVARRIVVYRKR